ncbi:PQQ-dependent sugar dehydrogenase [Alkalibacter saccharofermentans]|uniref:Glucose / Sorbosone dehydrogenase n=1 Tax=Alkalibacter saccharofermentans DSM 14828 TaxID=1120975 RepID=A0A1M4UV89_9FIRM|nr:PQQ-dependent sugar dehydrogenase [Alkalibacter saccharofermentans]SHE60598.1 Glucose / Sorbosone dehydrogenase [Alkalibacter saccharofermentans DSM 14828]
MAENGYTVVDAFPDLTFTRPVDIQNAGDNSGRLFIVEQAGRIYVLSGEDATDMEIFLDITSIVNDNGNEQGLLGLAFHPEHEQNGYFFVNYTDRSGTVISRFRVGSDSNQADPASQLEILTFNQPYSNHNGGQIAFGPDGYLYIATGDGGGSGDPQGHSQNRRTLHGNILRIDIDSREPGLNYAIPSDNPFVGNREGYREEIYAYGLRNPWRFSFDPLSGNLWAADVGQNAIEEINLIEKGKNYGWNIMEGTREFAPDPDIDTDSLELPVFEYSHPLGRSITGGHVYREQRHPELYGAYIYGDFVTGLIWALWHEEEKEPVNISLSETNLLISTFGLSEKNEIYLAAFDGNIYRLVQQKD